MLKSNRILRNQQKLIEQLKQTNELLHNLPEHMGAAGGQVVIENLHVEQAHLDKLLFELDKVAVQELSGTLNLGNNFRLDEARTQVDRDRPGVIRQLLNSRDQSVSGTTEPSPSQSVTSETGLSLKKHSGRVQGKIVSGEARTSAATPAGQMVATDTGFAVRIEDVAGRPPGWRGEMNHADEPGTEDG